MIFQCLFWFFGSTVYWDWGLVRRFPLDAFLIEFHLFSKRVESHTTFTLPRIGVFKGNDLVYFIYFGLISIILKRIWVLFVVYRSESVTGTPFPSEDSPVAYMMTTQEFSRYLKLHEITIFKYAAEGRFLLFGSVVYGDSIRMWLMIGSAWVKKRSKMFELPERKVEWKNLERKPEETKTINLIWNRLLFNSAF